MSAHRIVEMLRQSIDAAGTEGELKAPVLIVGSGAPHATNTEDAYLYLRVDPGAAAQVLYVNHTPGTASRSWTGLTN